MRSTLLFRLALIVSAIALLSGCNTAGSGSRAFGKPVGSGFKPADQVAPHCRAMVEGRMTLAECMQLPESRADGGKACIQAIQDMPARGYRP